MANETFGASKGYLYAKVETTEGTDATPDNTNWIPLESVGPHIAHGQDFQPNVGLTPERNGYGSTAVADHVTVGGLAVALRHPNITTGDATDVPTEHPLLVALGAQHTADATDLTHTYVWNCGNAGSATIYDALVSSDKTVTLLGKAAGVKLDGTLEIVGDNLVRFTGISGFGSPVADPEDTWTQTADAIPSKNDILVPAVGNSGSFRIIDLDNSNALLGGGSLASPGNGIKLISWTIPLGMSPQEMRSLAANGGAAGALHTVENTTMRSTLVVQLPPLNDWNWFQKRNDGVRLEINKQCVRVDGASTHTTLILAYAKVVGVDISGNATGFRTAVIELEHIFPEDPTDGDPPAGQNNTSIFKAGANQGLLADPTTTTGLRGVLAIQHQTTT